MYGRTFRQFSQPAVHISTPTTLPRSDAIVTGRPSVLNQGPPPARSGAFAAARPGIAWRPSIPAVRTATHVETTINVRMSVLRGASAINRTVPGGCKFLIKPAAGGVLRRLDEPVDHHRGEEQAEVQDRVPEERHLEARPAQGQD